MPGGLLQLVAIGIDSIFLTSNPQVTLFKVVYKRHTNFTLITRTKKIQNITEFGTEGTYIIPKEGDCVHKMWLTFNISDIKIEYPESTYKNIKDLCNKYSIEYNAEKEDSDIVTYNEYVNDIIPKFITKIDNSVTDYNKYIDYNQIDNNYNQTELPLKITKYNSTVEWCLDNLYNSYKSDIGVNVIDINYKIFFKLQLIKKIFSDEYTYDTSGNEIVVDQTFYNYTLLDNNDYYYVNYTVDTIEYIYKYAKNRKTNNTGTLIQINNWVDLYLDRLFLNLLHLSSPTEIFLIESDANNLQNIKFHISTFIDTLTYLLDNLYIIYNGKNVNNLNPSDFILITNDIARFNNLLSIINNQIDQLSNIKYLLRQYKHIYNFNHVDIKTIYDIVYGYLFDSNDNLKNDEITSDLLVIIAENINILLFRMEYSFNKLNDAIINKNDYSEYSNHVIQKFEYFKTEDSNSVSTDNNNLFDALKNYLNDILNTPEYDEKIYSINEINDILYNEYLTELTYSILGDSDIIPLSLSQEMKYLYLSFILIYQLEAAIPYNKNMVDVSGNYLGNVYDISKYYGLKMIDYFNNIIDSNKNPLIPILNFDETIDKTTSYKNIDTYKILNKFLKNSDIIYDDKSFNDTFVYKLTQTLKQNLFSNVHIIYNSILDNILTSSRHNITQLTRVSSVTNKDYIYSNTTDTELITTETDYYKFSFFKTFTNQISDSTKFTEIYGTSDPLLNDNFSGIFKTYQQNKTVYDIYFAEDILNKTTIMSHNIAKYLETTFFTGFFSDYKLWNRLILRDDSMKKLLQGLTFDKNTGNVINLSYYYDSSGTGLFKKRPNYPRDSSGTLLENYINSIKNVYDAYITPLNDKIKNNMAIFNYIPFLTIRDISSEFYEFIKYESQNTSDDFKNIFDYLYLFDFRDLDEYDIETFYTTTEIHSIINENLIFKYDLYKQIILNCLIRINRNKDFTDGKYDKDFETQIFDGNIFRLADSIYLNQFANTYLNSANLALFTMFRPENMIDITVGFESDIEITQPIYDSSNNLTYEYVQKNIKLPLIRGIVERFRLKLLKIINTNFDSSGNPIDISGNSIGELGVKKLKQFANKILNNYIKFDDTNNINNDKYSYDTYKANGYSFNYLDFQSVSESNLDTTGVSGLTNLKIFRTTESTYIQASSSLYSYVNKQMIREYNKIYNEVLLSDTYCKENLGENMTNIYYFIKSNLVDSSDNQIQYYNDSQVQYYYTYKYTNDDIFDPIEGINKINLYDVSEDTIPNTNNTFPLESHGFNFYSFGDTIEFEKDSSGTVYSITVNQDVFYYKVYNPYFPSFPDLSGNPLLNYQYFTSMSFLGYDIRRSVSYNDISGNNYVFKVPQYTQYYSNLLRIRNKFNQNKFNIMISLEELIDSLNDYDKNTDTYLYYSDAEIKIAERVKNNILSNYKVLKDIINNDVSGNPIEKLSIYNFIYNYAYLTNEFTKYYVINNQIELIYTDNIVSGEQIIPQILYNVFENSYNFKNNLNLNEAINVVNNIQSYIDYIEQNIYNIFSPIYFNNYKNKSDVIRLLMFLIINNTDLNFYIYNKFNGSIDNYNSEIQKVLEEDKINNFNYIKSVTKPRSSSIEIVLDTKITFSKVLPFIENLYMLPDYYLQTDILYHGSDVDTLFRNIVLKNPVKYCWVPELGQYLLENLSLEFDDLIIDEMNSHLRSLMIKLYVPYEQLRAYDILVGNTEKVTTYDELNKGNIKLRIPLYFFFYKEVQSSIPLINMLYTKAKIKFKLRKLDELLLYDPNAIITKIPKIKTSIDSQYIYLEEDERKRISSSKMEFLIERFKHYGKYNYNYNDIINNKLSTKIRPSDPTKYILWRLKVVDADKNKYNYIWNKNGYNVYTEHNQLNDFVVKGYENIKTIDDVKVYFNGSTREQGKAELFNTVFPYSRLTGSLLNDEYIYIFALYPLLYQPSGSANLSNIEEVMIEYKLNEDFINYIKENNLNIECEYWTCTYNILRYISGMCAPLFYS
jgi:hypothetical protein